MPPQQQCRPGHCVCGRPDCVSNARLLRRLFGSIGAGGSRFGSTASAPDYRRWLEPLARVTVPLTDIASRHPHLRK